MEHGSRLDSHSTKLPLRKGVLLQEANLNEQIDNGSSPDTGPVIWLRFRRMLKERSPSRKYGVHREYQSTQQESHSHLQFDVLPG